MEPDVAAEGDMSSKMQRRAIVDQETKKLYNLMILVMI